MIQVFAPAFYFKEEIRKDLYSRNIIEGKAKDLSSYFLEQVKEVFTKLPFKPHIIVMVPSHTIGNFSPTLNTLAIHLSHEYTIPYANVITRIRQGKKQTLCSGLEERHQQVDGAFKVDSTLYSMKDLKVVLLDDTKTTGLSLLECAKELKASGATTVVALCLGINY